jgi:hypothetical protein
LIANITNSSGTGQGSNWGSENIYYIDPKEGLRIFVILKDKELIRG